MRDLPKLWDQNYPPTLLSLWIMRHFTKDRIHRRYSNKRDIPSNISLLTLLISIPLNINGLRKKVSEEKQNAQSIKSFKNQITESKICRYAILSWNIIFPVERMKTWNWVSGALKPWWQREGDSNPWGACTPTRFPGVRLKPLGHLSILSRKRADISRPEHPWQD